MIVVTAGHIDHGKTSLVKALTGVDADRLPEEKSRGITIDLGFAFQRLADGQTLGFIDVPGHEKLVRNMLAGATGVDVALLVVAADDGVMPQTMEHLAILDLLGVARGVVALTKVDRVDPARVAEVETTVRGVLAGTGLRDAPIVGCSALRGDGVAELSRALQTLATETAQRATQGRFRLAVDRRFTLPGIGLVVTGTVHAGRVQVGDRLMLSPSGIAARVRGLRSQNDVAETASTGQRCALNLAGARLEKSDIARGDWVIAPELHAPTSRMDVRLRVLPGEARALRHWTPVHVHLGASDVNGRVGLLEDKALRPGEAALAQLVLDVPVGALFGDRFIIRDQSAQRTIGGGHVIDPFPPKRGARRPERLRVVAAIDRAAVADALGAVLEHAVPGVDLGHFSLIRNLAEADAGALWRSYELAEVTAGSQRLGLAPQRWHELLARMVGMLALYQDKFPDSPGATADELARMLEPGWRTAGPAALRRLIEQGDVQRFGQLLHLPGREIRLSNGDENLWDEINAALGSAGLDQPRVLHLAERLRVEDAELRPLLDKLGRIGRLRRVSKDYFMRPDTIRDLAVIADDVSRRSPAGLLTVGRFREATGIARHMTMPVLELFDKVGFTTRVPDGRTIRRGVAEIFGAAAE